MHREDVSVRAMPGWGRSAVVLVAPAVVAQAVGTRWKLATRHRGGLGADAKDEPVPPTTAGRRIGVEAGDRIALRAFGRPGPGELRALVSSVGHMGARHPATIGEVLAGQSERGNRRQGV